MRMVLRWVLCLSLLGGVLLPGGSAEAHGSALGTLKLQALSEDLYGVLWKRNRAAVLAEGKAIVWPQGCTREGAIDTTFLEAATLERMRVRCPQSVMVGGTVTLPPEPEGLHALIEFRWLDGMVAHQLIRDERAVVVTKSGGASASEVALRYTILGVEHIIFGIDHLLFVLGLLFLVATMRRLLWVVTAFTLAHSITLALAVFGLVQLPSAPVEACIALSIVLLAREALATEETLTRRYPWMVGFGFGLLHGLGFAGALSEVGLPSDQVPLALLTFNVGVELGQIAFVALVWWGLRWCAAHRPQTEMRIRTVSCYIMGSLAVWWTIERTLSIGG